MKQNVWFLQGAAVPKLCGVYKLAKFRKGQKLRTEMCTAYSKMITHIAIVCVLFIHTN